MREGEKERDVEEYFIVWIKVPRKKLIELSTFKIYKHEPGRWKKSKNVETTEFFFKKSKKRGKNKCSLLQFNIKKISE